MPIQVDYPSGLGTEDAWGLAEGAPSKLAAVKTDDGDSTFIYADSGGATRVQRFTFPLIVGVADPVTACSLVARARAYNNGAGAQTFLFEYNSVYVGSNQAPAIRAVRPAYLTVSYAAGGGELSLANVNTEHGFRMSAAGGQSQKWEVWVTQFYRSTNYSHAGGSADNFAHLMGSLIGSIGAGLLMRDMPALAIAIFRETRILITPSEYAEALRAWRSLRHVAVA